MRTNESPSDEQLVAAARDGELPALEQLVRRHQDFIYNVALRYALNPTEAQDLSQEALVKIVTRIATFSGAASFRTWAYRIVVNTFLDGKRGALEEQIVDFSAYGGALDALPLSDPPAAPPQELRLQVQEAKLGCMLGMLLCLDRPQRLVFILGDLFQLPAATGAEIFELTPAAYRKRLQRARADLASFMNDKCGLINRANPCRCRRKTAAFIEAGWVNPKQLKFTRPHLRRLADAARERAEEMDDLLERAYVDLYRQHPFYDAPATAERFRSLLADERVRRVFRV